MIIIAFNYHTIYTLALSLAYAYTHTHSHALHDGSVEPGEGSGERKGRSRGSKERGRALPLSAEGDGFQTAHTLPEIHVRGISIKYHVS